MAVFWFVTVYTEQTGYELMFLFPNPSYHAFQSIRQTDGDKAPSQKAHHKRCIMVWFGQRFVDTGSRLRAEEAVSPDMRMSLIHQMRPA